MRTDNMIGLRHDAKERVKTFKKEEYTNFEGSWNTLTLHKYSKDWINETGNAIKERYFEIIQCVPWSSGPCYFLCLIDIYGKRYDEWTDELIAFNV